MSATYRVTAPAEGFSGTVAGVEFVDGAGETSSPTALSYFRRHGYGIEAGERSAEPKAAKPAKRSKQQ